MKAQLEELKDAFIIDNATFSAALIPGSYDKIGRMSFGEPVSKTLNAKAKYAACTNGEFAYNQDASNPNKLEIWGYDYIGDTRTVDVYGIPKNFETMEAEDVKKVLGDVHSNVKTINARMNESLEQTQNKEQQTPNKGSKNREER